MGYGHCEISRAECNKPMRIATYDFKNSRGAGVPRGAQAQRLICGDQGMVAKKLRCMGDLRCISAMFSHFPLVF